MIRVVVIDDQEEIHHLLRGISEQRDAGFQVVSTYARPPDVTRLREDRPDVVVLDIVGCNGIEKAREIRASLPNCKVLFFTAYDHPAMVSAACGAGGRGYLVKPAPVEHIVAAIHEVARGCEIPPPSSKSDPPEIGQEVAERISRLTPREIEVVHWRAMGLTNQEVGETLGLSEKRVKNLVSRIFLKTGTSRIEQHTVGAIA